MKFPTFILIASIAACPGATVVTTDGTQSLTNKTYNGITATSGTDILSLSRGTTQIVVSGSGLLVNGVTVGGSVSLGAVTGMGSGVTSALAINTGSSGAIIVRGGAGGTPSSLTLTNATGLPTTSLTGSITNAQLAGPIIAPLAGITGAGTGITSALAVNTGSAGSVVIYNGAGGTPSSLTGTSITGTASALTSGAAIILATARTINGAAFDGSGNITVAAAAGTLTGGTLASGVTASSLTSTGVVSTGTWSGSFGSVSGANLTGITVAGSALTGTSLASGIVTSSLTSVGNVTTGSFSGVLGSTSGANLTALNGSNVSSGTIADARLSSNVALLGTNTFTAGQTINGPSSGTVLLAKSGANSVLLIDNTGAVIGASNDINWAGSKNDIFGGTTDGIIRVANYAGTGFTRFQIGGSVSGVGLSISANTLTLNKPDGTTSANLNVSGTLGVTGASTMTGTMTTSGIVIHNSTMRLKSYTVSTLPAGVTGDVAIVTDALTPAFLVTVVGGGSTVSAVFYNGTNWVSF